MMETGFDKEMDALLRRGRGPAVSTETAAGAHIDADAAAAFVENALPVGARRSYVRHLADCEPCRKLLSHAITLNESATETAAGKVAEVVSAGPRPWYYRFFNAPSLAVAMGALLVAFGGFFAYQIVREGPTDGNATVARVSETTNLAAPVNGVPEVGGTSTRPANVDPVAKQNANLAEQSVTAPERKTDAAVSDIKAGDADIAAAATTSKPAAAAQPFESKDAAPMPAREQPAAAPPLPITVDGLETVPKPPAKPADKAEADDSKSVFGGLLSRRRLEGESARRDAPAPAAKAGPSRAAGPVQTLSNQTQAAEMPVTRTVGGKVFQNRDGGWFDTAYRGQTPTVVRRGTAAFDRLDGSLRSIANSLGGLVVVVWKDKAYRIQ